MRLIAWMSEPRVRTLAAKLSSAEVVETASAAELAAAAHKGDVCVVDETTLPSLREAPARPVVLVTDEAVQGVVGWLSSRPWLGHVVSATMLEHPKAPAHFHNIISTLGVAEHPPRLLDWLGRQTIGRRVRLVQASRRSERLDKLTEFFEVNSVSTRTIQTLRDASEELLTNAFYDAPVAAGVVGEAISRTRDVCLPEDHACDLAYGCEDDFAFVRVRDPFGSLARPRLVEVLSRCARPDMQVEVDETMGGAGLGLWRIFSGASLVAISVRGGRSTEILVGVWKRAAAAVRPFCFHLFFGDDPTHRRAWKLDKEASTVTTAVTLVSK